jgi:hypothetical protein
MNKVRKSAQDLNKKKKSNIVEKFSKDIEILKKIKIKKKTEILKMKISINQIKTVENITNQLNHAEEGMSEIEDEVKEILHLDSSEGKNNKHDQNF